MNAPQLIQEVRSNGGVIWVETDRLELVIPDNFPEILIDELRERKAQIIGELSRPCRDGHLAPNHYESNNPGIRGNISDLLARLQAGQTWLLDQHERWCVGDATAATGAEFTRVWNGWWELDHQLRAEHGFTGCIYGPHGICPEGFPCEGCAGTPPASLTAQLALSDAG
ncbi:MAG: hypothetical protein O3A93_04780 [Chloroflexi bacterium]|nr:hypothetical protein [Chloroflexota bacterium]